MSLNTTLAYLLPASAQVPTTDTSRFQRLTTPDRVILVFASGTSPQAIWTIPEWPDAYQGGGLTLLLQAMATGTAGTVSFSCAMESMQPGGITNLETTTAFGTADTGTHNLPGGAGQLWNLSITLTHASPTAGYLTRLKLIRTDSVPGDVQFLGATLVESVSGLDLSGYSTVAFRSGHPLTFPNADGTSGNVLTTNGSGTLSWADIASVGLQTKTTNYTLTSADDIVLGDSTSGNITLTLPTAAGATGKMFVLKQTSTANAVTVATTSSQTIDGNTSITMLPYQSVTVVSNGSNWSVI